MNPSQGSMGYPAKEMEANQGTWLIRQTAKVKGCRGFISQVLRGFGFRFESNFGKFVQNSVTKIVKLGRKSDFTSWLPDGYSQILRSYVFCPSGFWKMAPVCTTLQNLIPSFPWTAPGWRAWVRYPRLGRDQIFPSGNLASHQTNSTDDSIP